MKRLISLLLVLSLVCALLAGCNKKDADPSPSPEQSGTVDASVVYKIGLLMPEGDTGWEGMAEKSGKEYCEELKKAKKIEYKEILCADADAVADGAKALREWGAQAVVVYPKFEDVEDALQSLINMKIPVVSLDLSLKCEGAYYVCVDNEMMGRLSARFIAEKAGDGESVVVLNSPVEGSVSTLRQKGFMEEIVRLAPKMTVEIYATRFKRESGKVDFENILLTHESVDYVYAMDDETAIGVLQAIDESDKKVKVLCGGGGKQEFLSFIAERDDIELQTSTCSPGMIKSAIDVALAAAGGETRDEITLFPTENVHKGNCESYIDEGSSY